MGKRWGWLLAAALLLASCGGSGQTVGVEGSTAMVRVMAALQEAYREACPEVRVNVSGTGSGAGIEAVLSGVCEIGLSSRELTEDETARGAGARVLALDGIAVIVHPSNPVRELGMEELAGIFTGKTGNWAQLGGEDRPIAVYGREAGSGTRASFEDAVGVRDRCVYTCEYCSTGDVAGNVAENPNGIGYVSMAVLSSAVRSVTLDGAACTAEAIRNGAYPLRRPMLLVKKGRLSEAAWEFWNFAFSPEAEPYIILAGAVPPGEGDG
ncbi:MAG: phosphate ABC transporter substrate-binding protein [Oscillospiraceae bacterium]|nr:phosphate ABC transporter substrate-binding protein [Oscillospiraceae bacterium]